MGVTVSLVLNIERGQSQSTLQNQLYVQIRESILSGTFRHEMPLPSSRRLAEDLGISRNTVVLAYERLFDEGYLQTQAGVGTFVTKSLPERCITVDVPPNKARERIAPVVLKRPRLAFRGQRLQFAEKGAGRPSIDFWYGSSNRRHFPLKAWRKLLVDNLSRTSTNLSDYGSPAGNLELRQALAERLGATRGIRAAADQVIITAGAQEGMNLISRLLIEPGVRVAVEDPCYGGAARAFESYGAAIVPIPVDNEGIDIAALEIEPAVLAYVTPSHQFPTGVTLSLERRQRLLKWATTEGAYIVEDDYDSDFRYDGPPLMALAGLDRSDCVIYLGTFSKSIGAGLRLGFLVVPEHLVDSIVAIKSLMNYGHPWLDQIVVAEFIKSGGYERHIRGIRRLYRDARDALLSALKRYFGEQYISGKYSGMHLMWSLPPSLAPANKFAETALAHDVGVYPIDAVGAVDFGGVWKANGIVLGYSSLSANQIEVGIKRLADAYSGRTSRRRAR
jgi:GntR family transcriptional regulator / MocR family aminotransferase